MVYFQPGGSPELKKILRDINEMVILPEYLTEEQRKKIYRLKYKKELERDPITIEIDGKKHEFRYRDMVRDRPSVKKGVVRAIDHMRSRQDFARNLFPLLEGCYSVAKLKPASPSVFNMIIRRAGDQGAIGAVLECIYKADQTKFFLQTHRMINELFFQLQRPAWESGWDRETTEKCLRRINKVLDLLEADQQHHHLRPGSGSVAYPPYRDPQFLAARLHLRAALALRPREAKEDEEHKKKSKWVKEREAANEANALMPKEEHELVAEYAREIVRLWPKGFGLLDTRPDEAYKLSMRYLLRRATFVWTAAPIASAFRMAQQVLNRDANNTELVLALKNLAFLVEEELQIALRSSLESPRAMSTYKALFPDAQLSEPAS